MFMFRITILKRLIIRKTILLNVQNPSKNCLFKIKYVNKVKGTWHAEQTTDLGGPTLANNV